MVIFSTPSAFINHDNHIPIGSFVNRTFVARPNFLLVRNSDSSNNAQISFDGVQGFTLRPGEVLSFELIHRTSYWTKALSGTPTLEVMYGTDVE